MLRKPSIKIYGLGQGHEPAVAIARALEAGTISDLSLHGCCIKFGNGPVRVGSRLRIRLEGMDDLRGTVRWIRGIDAGVEFDRPLALAATGSTLN